MKIHTLQHERGVAMISRPLGGNVYRLERRDCPALREGRPFCEAMMQLLSDLEREIVTHHG